jgi:hypothetical protein
MITSGSGVQVGKNQIAEKRGEPSAIGTNSSTM